MNNAYYPEIDVGLMLPLKVALGSMANDPLWLERAECPYDEETREELGKLFLAFRAKSEVASAAVEFVASGDKWGDLENELTALFTELRTYSNNIPDGDAKEKMAYFRTATSLLDKITGLAERAHNVRSVSQFTSKVISIFDDILSPEQRTLAIERLDTV